MCENCKKNEIEIYSQAVKQYLCLSCYSHYEEWVWILSVDSKDINL